MPAQTRGFLFSDLRGYSAYTERRGDRVARELLTRYRRVVREAIAAFGGAEIRTEGDSFYVVFDSVSQAVQAALAIQHGLSQETGEPIWAGIGVHAGDVEDDVEQGIVSSAVNIAARICALAQPGEVLVSETVRQLTRTYLEVTFIPRGRRRLKGISEPVAVYRVDPPGTILPRTWRTWAVPVAGALLVAAVGGYLLLSGIPFPGAEASASASAVPSSTAASPTGSTAASVVPIAIPSFDPETGPPDDWPTPLNAGTTYALTQFRPHTTFTVPDDTWRASVDEPDGFEVVRWTGPDMADGYLSAAFIQVVFEGPCPDASTRLLDDTPEALVEWLQTHPHLDATSPFPVSVGGYPGLSVDIELNAEEPDCETPVDPFLEGNIWLFPIGDTSFRLAPDEHIRVIVVEVAERPITFLAGTLGTTDFEPFAEAADAVLASMEFGP